MARARWAEDLVARWYISHGYTILARNWTMRGGELDVVARRANVVVVCEVKARATSEFGAPLEAITPQKVVRVQRAGHAFLREYRQQNPNEDVRVRFDVATVLGTKLEVFENFF
jgi:putative endonuclease